MKVNDVYAATVCAQWVFSGPTEKFRTQTLAMSRENAEENIRERYRNAYCLSIDLVKRGI